MNSSTCNNQDSQLNRVFEWISDDAPIHRKKCEIKSQMLPCSTSGPKKNLIDKESQLWGIKNSSQQYDMESVQPEQHTTDETHTQQVPTNFFDVNYTREKRSESESFLLDRFHPLANGNPQDIIQKSNVSFLNGNWSRNEARDNFKCHLHNK